MAIYQVTEEGFQPIEATNFADAGFKEREHLQQLLKQQINVIAPDTLVISEEFGSWEDSQRRIDLLGIDKDANLVVIELKRTRRSTDQAVVTNCNIQSHNKITDSCNQLTISVTYSRGTGSSDVAPLTGRVD